MDGPADLDPEETRLDKLQHFSIKLGVMFVYDLVFISPFSNPGCDRTEGSLWSTRPTGKLLINLIIIIRF